MQGQGLRLFAVHTYSKFTEVPSPHPGITVTVWSRSHSSRVHTVVTSRSKTTFEIRLKIVLITQRYRVQCMVLGWLFLRRENSDLSNE